MSKLIEDRNKFIAALINTKDWFYNNKPYYLHDVVDKITQTIETDEKKHFVSLSQEDLDKISYARSEKDILDSERRVKTTIERYIRRQLEISCNEFPDQELNILGRKIRQYITPPELLQKRIKFLSGDDIVKFYKNIPYSDSMQSCMIGDKCNYTKLYALNPDKVSLLTLDDECRALLWTTDCGTKILDRQYPNQSDKSAMLKDWAVKTGYVTREHNSMDDSNEIPLSDDNVYTITLKHDNVFPYLDTFCYGTIEKNKVILSNKRNYDGDICFHSTDGSYIQDDTLPCTNCGDRVDEDDIYHTDDGSYCRECYNELYAECYHCGGEFLNDNIIEAPNRRSYCEECYNEIYGECYNCNKTSKKDDGYYFDDEFYCEDCYNELIVECEHCENEEFKSDCNLIDNRFYCEKCTKKLFVMCSSCEEHILKSKIVEFKGAFSCEECFPEETETEISKETE